MPEAITIQWPFDAIGHNLAAICVLGLTASICLFQLVGRRRTVSLEPADSDLVGLLKYGFHLAWPVYWLIFYLLVIEPDLAFSAIITIAASMSFLPMVIADFVGSRSNRQRVHNVNIVLAAFFLLAALMLLAEGIGIDRRFSPLDGHFIITSLLLILWWGWYDRPRSSRPAAEVAPGSQGIAGKRLLRFLTSTGYLLIYHLAVFGIVLAADAFSAKLGLSGGIVLGLIFVGCWMPASVKLLRRCREPVNILMARSLAIVYLTAFVVVAGWIVRAVLVLRQIEVAIPIGTSVRFPFTLWQMEVTLLTVAAMFCLGLGLTRQSLGRLERLMLFGVYLIYLAVRVGRLILGSQ